MYKLHLRLLFLFLVLLQCELKMYKEQDGEWQENLELPQKKCCENTLKSDTYKNLEKTQENIPHSCPIQPVSIFETRRTTKEAVDILNVLKHHISCTDGKISVKIKIEITLICRFDRHPIQLVMFVPVGLSSIC